MREREIVGIVASTLFALLFLDRVERTNRRLVDHFVFSFFFFNKIAQKNTYPLLVRCLKHRFDVQVLSHCATWRVLRYSTHLSRESTTSDNRQTACTFLEKSNSLGNYKHSPPAAPRFDDSENSHQANAIRGDDCSNVVVFFFLLFFF